jgi:ABC-type transporter Mla subunit MlaD
MWSQLAKKQKLLLLSPLLINAIFVVIIVLAYHCGNLESEKEVNTERIIATNTTLSKLFYDCGLAIGAYSLTRNQNFVDRYQKLVGQISPNIETLHKLMDKQPVKQISFEEINQTAQEALKQLEAAKTSLNNADSPISDTQGEIRALYKQIKSLADQFQSKLDILSASEQDLAKDSAKYKTIYQILLALTFFCYVGFNLSIQQRFIKALLRPSQEITI